MVHRINVFLLSLFIVIAQVFTVSSAYASDKVDWELRAVTWKNMQDIRDKHVVAELNRAITEHGIKTRQTAVVETVATPGKVGGAMFKRVAHYAKTPGVQLVATMAAVELIEAIGWVMEDGTYVKKIDQLPNEPDPTKQFCYTISGSCSAGSFKEETAANTGAEMCALIFSHAYKTYGDLVQNRGCVVTSEFATQSYFYIPGNHVSSKTAQKNPNPAYDPDKVPEQKTVPLTPALLGAAMMGEGYKDPNPSFDNDRVNTGKPHDSALDAYKEENDDIGNELNKELDNKADNAPKSSEPKPPGHKDYSKPLANPDATDNDRKYDESKGNEGTSEEKDASSGEVTSSTKFSLPAFCDWAFSVCEWYEKWQKTDEKVNQHMTEEKDMWTRIRNFFGWATEEPTLKSQELQIDDVEIDAYERSEYVKFGATCPFSPSTASLPMGILGSMNFEIDLTFICRFGEDARPFVQGLGYLGGLIYLMVGLRNGNG